MFRPKFEECLKRIFELDRVIYGSVYEGSEQRPYCKTISSRSCIRGCEEGNWLMIGNILQLFVVVIAFVAVLVVTYYVTKWIAKSGMIQNQSPNIKVIETFKITTGKYIQIIQLGTKYYAIGVSKENITFLTSLEEDQLDFVPDGPENARASFKEIFDRFSKNNKEN